MTTTCWFVAPETERIDIAEGQWIEVKKALNVGEQRDLFRRVYPSAEAGEKLKLDVTQVGVAKVLAYVVAWSLCDAQGKPAPISEATVNRLHPDRFAVIREAVDAHEERIEAERSAEKNALAGVIVSSPISPSLVS